MASSHSPSLSSHPTTWNQAWNDAQQQLTQIRQSLLSFNTASPRITRVGQLDSELLDQELVQLLKEPLTKALSLVNSAWKARLEPELGLFIQLTLYKLSVWDLGASYGAQLQGLRYGAEGQRSGPLATSGLPRNKLLLHGAMTLLVPYLHARIRAHALSRAWPDAPSLDRRRKAWELLTRMESAHGCLSLLNFVSFLWNGRYRTTVDRLLGMRLAPARRLSRRDVSYEFMNRQMVWHAFTEFLLFLLPLINVRALRRRITALVSHASPSALLPGPIRAAFGINADEKGVGREQIRRGAYWALPLDQCAICAENASSSMNMTDSANAMSSMATTYANASATKDEQPPESSDLSDEPPPYPIHNPYITSCDHVYCYYCISERMVRTAEDRSGVGQGGTQWECLRCSEGVANAERLETEAEGPDYESGVDDEDEDGGSYEFGSEDMEFTDMSGSVGSYSGSGFSE
ncbi:hypothetical protein IEO21_00921 [Rhodonia placenta]|uniref:RING-type E3 ubiquitin transferase (cysteine targeting) n=1 Tax=Rhodonia placenta TaxID=104341 RepID=A0A8H7PAB9_9APHY|nr:hypothetical protein IEO21_00921 [Postia placenta]